MTRMKKHYIDLPEGQIHFVVAGQGQPVFLLHQSPMSIAEWDEIIPVLAKDFMVFAPDMPGHGQSYDPSYAMQVEDFAQVTLQLINKLGFEKVMLAGNHSGAALATCIATQAPHKVSKLIISCEMLASKKQIHEIMEAFKNKPISREIPFDDEGQFIADAWKRYQMLAPTSSLDTRYKPFIIGQAGRLRPYDIHHCVLEWMEKQDWVSQITCPTLVFGAENDLFYSLSELQNALTRIKQCEVTTISNAGALCTFENPSEISRKFHEFLTK
ncbi:alpha/beta hydrolase [Aliiglaciecola sp. 3_MG-2023]|uniref:alpha/beta fold hydrolase n=1 Tax=Aliiglaciecola sp. 3_MG-2023 TaxID=3062644 RepID=UPI0026E1819E|nr:alpha/beta hydrolase [Aliiglaciecola sp. 3_MG-2023]MDO6693061.1 alpha/beta hydrolase [Aliiglaciecola sp. 3_MG-2023]